MPDLPNLLSLLSRVACHVYSGELRPDGEYRETFTGPGLPELLGRNIPAGADVSALYHDAVHPDDWSQYVGFGLHLALDSTAEAEYRLVQPDGSVRWVLDRMWLRERRPGGCWLVDGLVSDVTERRLRTEEAQAAMGEVQRVNAELERARADVIEAGAWLEAAVRASPSALVIVDHEMRTRLWNPAAETLFGWTAAEALGRVAPHCRPEDRPQVRAVLDRHLAGESLIEMEQVRTGEDGRPREVSVVSAPVVGPRGEITGFLGIFSDITARKEMEGRLRQLAHYDPLTGLGNRVLLTAAIERAVAKGSSKRSCVSVVLVDLDGFKAVNDSFGHIIGDELLCAVAQRITGCVRPGDSVARLGGDEFAVLLRTSSRSDAVAVAERLRAVLQEPVALGRAKVVVTGSIGVVHAGNDQGPSELLRDADVAMYSAKALGKNRVAVFKPAMQQQVAKRLNLEGQIRRAVERRQFELFFQPFYDLRSSRIVGAEALIRWRHPRRGLLPPSEFISATEETGLIVPLGRWILEDACATAALWRSRYGAEAPAVSVNLSARQLQDPDLVADVAVALERSGLDGGSLRVEITETMLVDDRELVAGKLAELRSLGVRVALDDFGTGFSSLSYLSRFPVDVLKIDQSFVAPLGEGPRPKALVRSIVELARALDVSTVAEGVENADQARILRNLGCSVAQGYYLSRPGDAATMEAILEGQARGRRPPFAAGSSRAG